MSNFTWVDNAVLIIFFISVLAGLLRGLIREVIAVLTWLAAFIVSTLFASRAALYFTSSPQVQSVVSNASESMGMSTAQPISILALGISFISIFVLTLIAGSIINYFVSGAVEGRGISFTNRLLGGVFGLIRGFLLVLLAIFLVGFTPLTQQPWWQQSQFVHSFQPAVKWLSDAVQPGLESIRGRVGDTLKNVDTQYFQGAGQNLYQQQQQQKQ